MEQVPWARDLAHRLLAGPLPRRWAHTEGVARKAESIAHIVGQDAGLLMSAAWLHDIGYAPNLIGTGFHPLDGARYLRDVEQVDSRLCRLVANHSFATTEAGHRGLGDQLNHEFANVSGLIPDALTYCDMTTDPDGRPVSVQYRLHEVLLRYGKADPVNRSIREARPHIIASTERIMAILRRANP